MHDLCWMFCQHFQGYKSFYNPARDSELERAGVLLCSVLLPVSPFLSVPALVSPLSRHGLGFRGKQRDCLHSLAVLGSATEDAFNKISAALRYLCFRKMWLEGTWLVSLLWESLERVRLWCKIHWSTFPWKGCFPMFDFGPIMHSHLENTGFLGFVDLLTHFFLQYQKDASI